jgi:hypothetical protein
MSLPVQMEAIKKSMQKDTISSFWTMLQELDSVARDTKDKVLMHWVVCWYKQWNAITNDEKVPSWLRDQANTYTDTLIDKLTESAAKNLEG